MFDVNLLLVATAGIALLLFLVVYLKVSAFLALLLTSFLVGLGAGMPATEVINSVTNGMGGTLGYVAIVVGLGAILGQMLEASGGIALIANTLINRLGSEKIQWSLGLTGFLVAIPVFFDVAFIILAPVIYGLAKRSNRSLLYYAIPLLAGLAVTHSFIPPTPGPIAVAELVNAKLGWVILFGSLAGAPAMIIAGPVFGQYIAKKIKLSVPKLHQSTPELFPEKQFTFDLVIGIILLPLILITASTIVPFIEEIPYSTSQVIQFLGHPFIALTLTTLLAMFMLNQHCSLSKEQLLNIANKGLEPAGIVILITGAGGAFKQLLIDSGVGQMLGELMLSSNIPILLLAFIIAAITRIAQGSATVAMITAAGLIAPILELQNVSDPMLGLIVIAISSGATILSHVNDSGFWLVNRYLGMTEKQTFQSWTVLSTIISLVGISVCMLISLTPIVN